MSAIARVAAGDSEAAAVALRRDGVTVVENLWDRATIDELRGIIDAQHPEFADPAKLDDYFGYKDRRFIAPVRMTPAVRDSGLLQCTALDAVCTAMLGETFVYEAFGMIWVNPGTPSQKLHRDGASLFPELGISRLLPPFAMTVAIPLVDVDHAWAPTGVALGSHRIEGDSSEELVAVELDRGSAAIWDFRVLHAGLANQTDRPRPALYFTVCRPFWSDNQNFYDTARAKLVGDPEVIAALGPRFVRARAA